MPFLRWGPRIKYPLCHTPPPPPPANPLLSLRAWVNQSVLCVDCPKNSGMCKDGKQNMGSVNSTLVYRQGFLYLHYKNGDKCESESGRKMETFISFMCDPKGEGEPTLERTNDCTHFVTWKTKLACEAEVCRKSNLNDVTWCNMKKYCTRHDVIPYLQSEKTNESKMASISAVRGLLWRKLNYGAEQYLIKHYSFGIFILRYRWFC